MWTRTGHDPIEPATELASEEHPDELASSSARIRSLEHALGTSRVIGIAIGIVMERHQTTVNEAFAMLIETARAQEVTVHDLAADLASRRKEWGAE
jgi:AmiR/NasT family two-component response regulator